jgi:Flp pilus assembly protein TadB
MISRIVRYSIVLGGFMFMFAGMQAQRTWAQDHVVSSSDLRKDVSQAAQTRQAQEAKIEEFLRTPQAKKALAAASIDYKTVQKGVPLLNDREVAELSARADKAQKDFAAGSLTNQELTYIVIALATAVIILVIVYH